MVHTKEMLVVNAANRAQDLEIIVVSDVKCLRRCTVGARDVKSRLPLSLSLAPSVGLLNWTPIPRCITKLERPTWLQPSSTIISLVNTNELVYRITENRFIQPVAFSLPVSLFTP